MQELFLGAYWRERRESLNRCLVRVQRWLAATNAVAAKSLCWCEEIKAPSGEQRYVVLESQDQLREMLLRSRPRGDARPVLLPGGGYAPWFYLRPESKEPVAMHITCGGSSPWLFSVVTIRQVDRMVCSDDTRPYRELLAAAAEIWEPDWAAVLPSAATMNGEEGMPFVDWMVYVSKRLMPEPPKLKSPAVVEPCADGTLIIVQEEPPDPEDEAQQRHVKRVAKKVWEAVQLE